MDDKTKDKLRIIIGDLEKSVEALRSVIEGPPPQEMTEALLEVFIYRDLAHVLDVSEWAIERWKKGKGITEQYHKRLYALYKLYIEATDKELSPSRRIRMWVTGMYWANAVRDNRGWSQKELADALGKKASQVSRWYTCETVPSADAIEKLQKLRREID